MQTSVLFQMFIFFYVFRASYDGEMVIMPVKSSAFLMIIVRFFRGGWEYGSFPERKMTLFYGMVDTFKEVTVFYW